MKNKRHPIDVCIALALGAIICGAAATSALAGPVAGEHEHANRAVKFQSRQTRELAHFTGLSVGANIRVELRLGDAESVTIETDANLPPMLDTVIENGMLRVRPANNMRFDTRSVRVVVRARQIDHISLGGSASVGSDTLRARKLQIDVSGSGSFNVRSIDAESVSVALSGSGGFKVGGGRVNHLSIVVGGSGDVNAGALRADDVSVSIGGSGKAMVWARDHLSVSIAGSGDVAYYGDPIVRQSVAGSGSVKRMGGAAR